MLLKGELFALWQRSQLMTGACEKYPSSQSGSPSVLVLHLQWWQGEVQVREGLCACICRLVLCPCTFPGSTAVLDMLEGKSLPSPFSTHHTWCLNFSNLSLNLLILSASTASCGSKVYKFCARCPKKHFYLFRVISHWFHQVATSFSRCRICQVAAYLLLLRLCKRQSYLPSGFSYPGAGVPVWFFF